MESIVGNQKEKEKEKFSGVNYVKRSKEMICLKHKKEKEAEQPLEKMMSSMFSLYDKQQPPEEEDEDEDEDGEFFLNSDDEKYWREEEKKYLEFRTSYELELLDGALPPDPLQPLDSHDIITNEGVINHSLVASSAVNELATLASDTDGVFWTNDGILNQQSYQQHFPKPKPNASWTHATRASTVVYMDHTKLLQMLTNYEKWTKLFQSIVSHAICLRFLVQGSSRHNPDGSLQLIYTKLQATTPYVPKKALCFLRTCKKIDHSTWVVADISIDRSRNIGYPCGCLIQRVADGFSQVTWVEHLEFQENYLDRNLFNDLTCRGFAFGAQRWVACLERSCERRSYRTNFDLLVPCIQQDDPWQYEKKRVMKLSQRIVSAFCSNIGSPDMEGDQSPRVSSVPSPRNLEMRIFLAQSPYHDDPKEMILISRTTFSLPHSPEFVFKTLGDENRRQEWDVLGKITRLRKPTCYTTGNDPRNRISVFQTHFWIGDEVVLQEASVNRSGSLLAWSALKKEGFDLVRNGKKCASRLPLIGVSGLAISSNSHQNDTNSSSIVTLAVQQEARDIKNIEPKMLESAKKLVIGTVHKVEAVLTNPAGRNFY